MNHHVAEETARLRNILKRGRIRIATGNRQLFKIADLAVLNSFLDRSMSRVKPPVEGQEDLSCAIFQRVHTPLRFGESRRERLLTHHSLSGLDSVYYVLHVRV
jgi:hypothetical protein